jgi:nitrate/nitrite-specific signal transduction histidine kinase
VFGHDGIGFDRRQVDPRGLGLTGMRERAALLGGRLRISSRPGTGTRVVLFVPSTASVQLGAPLPAAEQATLHGGP